VSCTGVQGPIFISKSRQTSVVAKSGSGTGGSRLPPSSAAGKPNRVGAQKAKANNKREGGVCQGESAFVRLFFIYRGDPVAKASLLNVCIYGCSRKVVSDGSYVVQLQEKSTDSARDE